MSQITLYALKTAQSARQALYTTQTLETPFRQLSLVVEDAKEIEIVIVDDVGAVDPISTDGTYTRKLAMGLLGQTPIALQTTSTATTDGRKFVLNTNTTGALALLGTSGSVEVYLEYELTSSGGDIITIFQQPVTLFNQVTSSSTPAPTPSNQYYTKNEQDARFARTIDETATWAMLEAGGHYIYRGSASLTLTVNSAKSGITIANASAFLVEAADTSLLHVLNINPGSTIRFSTTYVSGNEYSITETPAKATLSQLANVTSSPPADSLIQRKSGSWTARTLAQIRDDLQALATWAFAGTVTTPGRIGQVPISGEVLNREQALNYIYHPQRPRMRPNRGVGEVANSGSYNNWGAPTNNCWVDFRHEIGASAAAGWARMRQYNFMFKSGEAGATRADRRWAVGAWVNFPSETTGGLRTDLYFGNNGDTGGALTTRGLRVSFIGHASGYTIEAAIHNGTAEVVGSATVSLANTDGGILIVWEPVGGSTPGAGSALRLFTRSVTGEMVERCAAVLSGSLGAPTFAGSAMTFIASSSGTGPAYTVSREIGGIEIIQW